MEKRTLYAIILSVSILYAWGVLFSKKPVVPPPASVENVENKEVANQPLFAEKKPKPLEQSDPSLLKGSLPEEIQTITTNKLKVEFSSLGGKIKSMMLKQYDAHLPIDRLFAIKEFAQDVFQLKNLSPTGASFISRKKGVTVVRRYEVAEDDYLIQASVEIYNESSMSKQIELSIEGLVLDISRLDNDQFARDQSLFEYSISSASGISRKSNAFKFSAKENINKKEMLNWAGFRDRYFCALIKPRFSVEEFSAEALGNKSLAINFGKKMFEIPANGKIILEATILYSPQELFLLKKYNEGFEGIFSFSRFGLVDVISKGLYYLTHTLYKFIPSPGIILIILAFVIYGLTYPLTVRGMLSMKKMQSVQPEVTALREKYKNNPQKIQQETMELYKKYKINPFGGCFPLILQMPIFISIYQVLWRSVLFKGSGFLWIKDLAEPDRLFILPYSLPVIGNEINILPVLMSITMFFQQKVSSQGMSTADPAQASQQKIMMVFFPIFLGFVFYKFSSGLALYFTIFYVLSTFTQLKMSKMAKA